MKVLNDLFDYGLKICQDTEYFKFSIDSILLAEFVKYKKGDSVLDLCTGNAPIPLILSTKDTSLTIDGIEIQRDVYELAKESVEVNKLEKQITILQGDAKTLKGDKKYEVVTCNPPYFKVTSSSQKNENEIKCIARHEIKMTLEDAIKAAKRNLKETGTFFMVHRAERLLETLSLLEKNKFGVREVVFIFTKDEKKAEFFLIEASNYKKSDVKIYSYNICGKKSYKGLFARK